MTRPVLPAFPMITPRLHFPGATRALRWRNAQYIVCPSKTKPQVDGETHAWIVERVSDFAVEHHPQGSSDHACVVEANVDAAQGVLRGFPIALAYGGQIHVRARSFYQRYGDAWGDDVDSARLRRD